VPLIENRQFLIWSSTYFLILVVVGFLADLAGFPVSGDEITELVAFIVIFPAAILGISITLTAIFHIIEHKNYEWFLLIIILAYVGAYLYGFLVASKTKDAL